MREGGRERDEKQIISPAFFLLISKSRSLNAILPFLFLSASLLHYFAISHLLDCCSVLLVLIPFTSEAEGGGVKSAEKRIFP